MGIFWIIYVSAVPLLCAIFCTSFCRRYGQVLLGEFVGILLLSSAWPITCAVMALIWVIQELPKKVFWDIPLIKCPKYKD